VQPVLVGIGTVPQVQGHAGEERLPIRITKFAHPGEALASHAGARLDLECYEGAIVAFDDEINLIPVVGSPVPHSGDAVEPGHLLTEFTDHECLEKVPEFGEHGRLAEIEFVRRQAK